MLVRRYAARSAQLLATPVTYATLGERLPQYMGAKHLPTLLGGVSGIPHQVYSGISRRGPLSRQLGEHLLHFGDVVSLLRRTFRILDAPRESGGDQYESRLLHCLVGGRELRHDVTAIATFRDHLLHAPELALRATQPLEKVADGFLGKFHGISLTYPTPYMMLRHEQCTTVDDRTARASIG